MIVEFLGIARSGKTTIAKILEKEIPNIIYYPERHDLVPKEIFGNNYEHNLWYAKYCIQKINEIQGKSSIHLFERGIIDRVIIGRAYFKMKWFSNKQLADYENILKPYVDMVDSVFVFLIPVEESVKRAEIQGKDVTSAIPYLNVLYSEYKNLGSWVKNCVFLPENTTIDVLEKEIIKNL